MFDDIYDRGQEDAALAAHRQRLARQTEFVDAPAPDRANGVVRAIWLIGDSLASALVMVLALSLCGAAVALIARADEIGAGRLAGTGAVSTVAFAAIVVQSVRLAQRRFLRTMLSICGLTAILALWVGVAVSA